jgi:hypothetical protein
LISKLNSRLLASQLVEPIRGSVPIPSKITLE